MKRILLGLTVFGLLANCLGQGTVVFNNHVAGTIATRVYLEGMWSVPHIPHTGNTAADTPPGTQTYFGTLLTGSAWTAQLFSIPGNIIPAGPTDVFGIPWNDPFVGALPTTTFRSGTAAGIVAATTATLANVAADASAAVLQLRVFPTGYGSWAAAYAASQSGSFSGGLGASPMFVVNGIGGWVNTPPNLVGLQSFAVLGIPEPGAAVLLGLGLVGLRWRRWARVHSGRSAIG
jgi:hypothetical protein